MFGVRPNPDYAPVQYGGYDYHAASNIVFSNGEYDPWRVGALLGLQVPFYNISSHQQVLRCAQGTQS